MADGRRGIGLALAAGVTLALGCGVAHRIVHADDIARGRQLFTTHGCNGCHTVGALGTPIGPDLTAIGRRHSVGYFERWLRDPAAQQPLAHMPRLDLPGSDIPPLAAYLASLR